MATDVREDVVRSEATLENVKAVLEALRGDGERWLKSIADDDWRRLRYFGEARNVRRGPVAATLRFGPDRSEIVENIHGIDRYLAMEPSRQSEALHCYILVKADNQAIDDRAVAFIRPVSKIGFDKKPHLNFHVWFHRLAPSGVDEQVMFGLRLESPEGGDVHDYYHAQPLSCFGPQAACQGMPAVFSQRFPTVPLNASDVLDLCLNTVLIACGKDALRELIRTMRDEMVRQAARIFWKKMFGSDVPTDAHR